MKEAKYWEKLDDSKVQCRLCPHHCKLRPDKQGICKNKLNVNGKLFASHYGEISALNLDPIEKKPLYHFHPGEMILSVGTQGCNLACSFCQNYHLWDGDVPTSKAMPADIVSAARRQHSFGIAYTYNEPYMSFEYVLDTARLARDAGLKNVMVTNGFYNPEPLEELLPLIDAMNIDLKSIRDDYYKKLCHGRVEPVMKTIARAAQDCLVEVTTLLVTGENDSDQDISDLVDFIASVGDVPLHFSAYHPMYTLDNPPTPMKKLLRAYEIGRQKLNYVYLGNVMADVGNDSTCPSCNAVLVRRRGYTTTIRDLKNGKCQKCDNPVKFIGK
ncbi:MAG TPA: AmmeMemoRadiSam system radical SAM enzyme [bacterium]|nr:AmmeMemoRadiSam system radical SAM enzyme [bacterium]